MFSLMKQIKMDGRSSLSGKILSTFIWICMKGPEPEFFDPILAMTLWNDAVKSQTKLGIAHTKNVTKTGSPILLDLEDTSDNSNSAGENILLSLE